MCQVCVRPSVKDIDTNLILTGEIPRPKVVSSEYIGLNIWARINQNTSSNQLHR